MVSRTETKVESGFSTSTLLSDERLVEGGPRISSNSGARSPLSMNCRIWG